MYRHIYPGLFWCTLTRMKAAWMFPGREDYLRGVMGGAADDTLCMNQQHCAAARLANDTAQWAVVKYCATQGRSFVCCAWHCSGLMCSSASTYE